MKTLLLGILAMLFSINNQAQNKNVKSEVKTTTKTYKDSDGERKTIKTQEIQEVQNIEFEEAKTNLLNKETKETPVQVIKTTKITENGITKNINIDRSAYYNLNGGKYQLTEDNNGYSVLDSKGTKAAVLRKTSNNNYIYKTKKGTSYGYFDTNGNLILETYDEKKDKIIYTKYDIIQK